MTVTVVVDQGAGRKKDIIYIIFALCHRCTVNTLNEIRVTGEDIKKIITIHTYI